jgi:glyoxylate reductase
MSNLRKYRVFVSTTHPGDAVQRLARETDAVCSSSPQPVNATELMRNLLGKDGIVSVLEDRISAEVIERCRNDLKVIANVAVGFDNIDVAAATKHGVLVTNTPGVLDKATSEVAFALLLAAARRIVEGDRFVRSGRWKNWRSDLLLGSCLDGKTLGIIGLGRIGQAMARRARAFEMNIVYHQRNRAPLALESELGGAKHLPLDELLRTSDAVSVHCPLTADTRHLLSAREFSLIKSECIVVNTARGPIIDEKALVNALASNRVRAAALDVFENEPQVQTELLSMENVVLAPHIGSATTETRSQMARLAVDGILATFDGKLPVNAVNPQVWPVLCKRLASAVPLS